MPADRLTRTFAAIADPTRRAILAHLMTGEAPTIPKHPKVLENAGLVSRGRAARRRLCRIRGAERKDAADGIQQRREAHARRSAGHDRLEDDSPSGRQ